MTSRLASALVQERPQNTKLSPMLACLGSTHLPIPKLDRQERRIPENYSQPISELQVQCETLSWKVQWSVWYRKTSMERMGGTNWSSRFRSQDLCPWPVVGNVPGYVLARSKKTRTDNSHAFNSPVKIHRLSLDQKIGPTLFLLLRNNLTINSRHHLKIKGWKMVFQVNRTRNKLM